MNRSIEMDSGEPEASTVVTLLQQIGSRVPSSEDEVANLKVDLKGLRGGPLEWALLVAGILATIALSLVIHRLTRSRR